MTNPLHNDAIDVEIANYNRKRAALTNKFVNKMNSLLSSKKTSVKQIDTTIKDLSERKTQTEGDIGRIESALQNVD